MGFTPRCSLQRLISENELVRNLTVCWHKEPFPLPLEHPIPSLINLSGRQILHLLPNGIRQQRLFSCPHRTYGSGYSCNKPVAFVVATQKASSILGIKQ